MQRILATNADLAYSSHGESNGGSAVNGICLNGSLSGNDQGGETSLHTIFLELPEKHMAEQLTKLDTVFIKQMTHSLRSLKLTFFFVPPSFGPYHKLFRSCSSV